MKAVFRRVRKTTDLLNKPWMWLCFSAFVLIIDFLIGPFVQFPIAFIIPVALSAWHRGLHWAIPFAILLPFVRLSYNFVWEVPWTIYEAIASFFVRILVLMSFAFLVNRTARQTRELEREVKILEGILPICGHCKKIRDTTGGWQQLETYISKQSEAKFSHTICPHCTKEHWDDYLKE